MDTANILVELGGEEFMGFLVAYQNHHQMP